MRKFLYILFIFAINVQAQPGFMWAKRIGGSCWDNGASLFADIAGNTYVLGRFAGTVDVDPGLGTTFFSTSGWLNNHMLLVKLDPAGNFIWAKDIGGTGSSNVYGSSMQQDVSGNIYITGYFDSTVDFNPGLGVCNMTSSGQADIFISKLDASGNFIWAKQMGGSGWDCGNSIVQDLSGNVFITGAFQGAADFDPSSAAYNLSASGYWATFIVKLDGSGNFVWAKKFDASNGCSAIDQSKYLYTTGSFGGAVDFDPGSGVYNLTASTGFSDIYVSKLDTAGNLIWAKGFGSPVNDYGSAICADVNGNVIATGGFQSTADFDPNAGVFNLTSNGNYDCFITKLDGSGNFVWAKQLGGPQMDVGGSLTLDNCGNIYTLGLFKDTADLDPGVNSYNLISSSSDNIFISLLDSSGAFNSAVQMGGTSNMVCSIALDRIGNILTTGGFKSTSDFDPGAGTCNLTSNGDKDIFISKLKFAACHQIITENETTKDEIYLRVYPNPSHGSFTIENRDNGFSYSVFNYLGQRIISDQTKSRVGIIDLGDQAAGIYYLEIISESQITVKKIIIN